MIFNDFVLLADKIYYFLIFHCNIFSPRHNIFVANISFSSSFFKQTFLSGIKKQDGYVGIVGVAQNLKGRDLAWSWFLSNWELIRTYYDIIVSDISMPGVSSAISVIIKVSCKVCCTCSDQSCLFNPFLSFRNRI
jgi:hypothetical protein